MISLDIKDMINDNIKIENKTNDIWFFLLIIVIILILKYDILIFQYLLLTTILFLFQSKNGILYTNIVFYLYNYKKLFTDNLIKNMVIFNFCLSVFIIFLNMSGEEYYLFDTFINLYNIGYNIFLIKYLDKKNIYENVIGGNFNYQE